MVGQWYPDRLCGLRTGSGLKLREERALLLWGHLRDVSLKKTSRPQIWGLSGGWRPSHIPSVDLEPEALFTHKDLRHHTLLPWSCSPDLENSLSEVIPHQARKIKARNYLSNSPYVESPNPVSSLQLSLQNYQFERARGKEAGQVTSNGGRKQQASARGLLGEVRFRCRPEAIGRGDPRVRHAGPEIEQVTQQEGNPEAREPDRKRSQKALADSTALTPSQTHWTRNETVCRGWRREIPAQFLAWKNSHNLKVVFIQWEFLGL